MTREEAINFLQIIQEDYPLCESEKKSIEMAIQALSQEPCDDVVSRQAVINAIENDCMKGGLGSCFACYNDAQAFRGEIEKLPSVTQKSGKWHRKYDRIVNELYWECNKCGEGFQLTSNFCPNCGAKMESEDRTE